MKLTEIHTIDDFSDFTYPELAKGIKQGLLVTFNKNSGIKLRKTEDFSEIYVDKNSYKYLNYKFYKNELLFSIENEIFRFNLLENKFAKCGFSEEEYAVALSNKYLMGRTYTRNPKVLRSQILSMGSNQSKLQWNDKKMPIAISEDDLVIFNNPIQLELSCMSLKNQELIWSHKLIGFTIPRYFQMLESNKLLFMQRTDDNQSVEAAFQLNSIDIFTGKIEYQSSGNHFNRYQLSGRYLHAISGNSYLKTDSLTGQIIEDMLIPDLNTKGISYWANIGRQTYHNGKLYFTISGMPILGIFDTLTLELVELIEVDIDKSKVDMSQPLEMPIVHMDKLYIRDNSAKLHILKME